MKKQGKTTTRRAIGRRDGGFLLGTPPRDWTKDNTNELGINICSQIWYYTAPEMAASTLELNLPSKGWQTEILTCVNDLTNTIAGIRQNGYCTLEPLAYGIHCRVVKLVKLFKSPSTKYVDR